MATSALIRDSRVRLRQEWERDLVLHWQANDMIPGGYPKDQSFHQEIGLLISAPPLIWYPEINSWARDFDGSADAIAFPSLQLEKPFTVIMLANLDATGGTLAGERDGTDYRWQFWSNAANIRLRYGNGIDIAGNTAVSTGKWYWMGCNMDSGNAATFARLAGSDFTGVGLSYNNASTTQSINGSGPNPVAIGARWDTYPATSFGQDGKIANCFIWDRYLSQNEVAEMIEFLDSRLLQGPTQSVLVFEDSAAGNSATAAPTIAGATAAASATFTAPSYSATTALTIAGAAASASSTFTAQTYSGTSGLTLSGATSTVASTFTAPTYSATSSVALGGATSSASATFATQTYTATASALAGGATATIAATFTAPTYSATVGPTLAALESSSLAAFASAIYGASSAVSLPGASASIAAAFTPPVYTASLAASLASASASVVAQFTEAGSTYTATCSVSIAALMCDADNTTIGQIRSGYRPTSFDAGSSYRPASGDNSVSYRPTSTEL